MILTQQIMVPASSGPDYVAAFIGVFGVMIGGAIGLMGQHWSHKETRRKELRKNCADILSAADRIRNLYLMVMDTEDGESAVNVDRLDEVERILISMRANTQYIELVMDWHTHQRVQNVHLAVETFRNFLFERMNYEVPLSGARSDNVLATFDQARTRLVDHLKPIRAVRPMHRSLRVLLGKILAQLSERFRRKGVTEKHLSTSSPGQHPGCPSLPPDAY